MKTLKEIALGFATAYAATALCLPGLALATKAIGFPETALAMLEIAARLVFVSL
jgi:hypothetical protein